MKLPLISNDDRFVVPVIENVDFVRIAAQPRKHESFASFAQAAWQGILNEPSPSVASAAAAAPSFDQAVWITPRVHRLLVQSLQYPRQ